ncbi:putative membrane protein YCR023C-like protein 6 [Colletotrichum chlorophyti]|uniref:Putative membrane protein YCR023C-like protein 6 n=1 Tax=Colletotrichum chlorophyti TaxID=708187 RepID=A0A1Q8S3X1_9PEZI|nr:putative membrane protein YCR023C-like protein 6 [Colletotrichum chlorophyti]
MAQGRSDVASAWRSLPKKGQLFVLCLARLSEPITRTSFSTYIFYQLQSLDPSLTSTEIVKQAAWMQTALTIMQAMVSLPLSRLADSSACGRKPILLVGLGVLAASTLYFGFITSFRQALLLRMIEGSVNGNTVVIRTMVSEVVTEKRHQPRAFLLLPLTFNVGALIGPPVAGFLVSYAREHVSDSAFLARWTYAPPMLLMGSIITISFLGVFFFLEETLPSLGGRIDIGLRLQQILADAWHGRMLSQSSAEQQTSYEALAQLDARHSDSNDSDNDDRDCNKTFQVEEEEISTFQRKRELPLRLALTKNVLLTTACQGMLDGITMAYNILWSLFLSDPPKDQQHGLRFSGGAGLEPSQIALSIIILAVGALPLQIFVYPRVCARVGTLKTFRWFSWCLPFAFAATPFIAIAKDRPALMWGFILIVQLLVVFVSAMVVPSITVLTNKLSFRAPKHSNSPQGLLTSLTAFFNSSSPHPSALATTHGLAVTFSAIARTISPLAASAVYAYGQSYRFGGLVWWLMAATGICVCILSHAIYEGSGQEVQVPSEDHGNDTDSTRTTSGCS